MGKNQKMMIIGGVILVVLLVAGIFVFNSRQSKQRTSSDGLPEDSIIPTVDGSVVVELEQGAKKGEAILTIKNAPNGTRGIEYTISYDAESTEGEGGPVPQGAIGKCTKDGNVWQCGEPSAAGRKIVLGTCSSGVCRYHKIIGDVRVSLKFSGDYGERIFEKDYEI